MDYCELKIVNRLIESETKLAILQDSIDKLHALVDLEDLRYGQKYGSGDECNGLIACRDIRALFGWDVSRDATEALLERKYLVNTEDSP